MKRLLIAAFALCATTAQAEWSQIKDANSFGAAVVGNAYADGNGNWFRFNANGTLDGGANGQALTGNWRYRNGMACFSRALGGNALPSDCIVVMVDGNRLVTVRDQGRGRQTLYTRQ